MQIRDTVLVCPRNDAESMLIELIAALIGVTIVTSKQGLGATLEKEPALEWRVLAGRERTVIIVEIPGPETEERFRERGFNVVIIDHHTYNDMDRSHGPDGARLPSSLEQFCDLLKVTNEEISRLNIDPKSVRGLGVLDDRYAQGLRDEGYTPEEIDKVLALREQMILLMDPTFRTRRHLAEDAWAIRETRGDYTVVCANGDSGVRGEIGIMTIREGCDTKPLVIVEPEGRAVFVQNVEPSVVEMLRTTFADPKYNTFTFGAGRCWGTDSRKGEKVDPDAVFTALGI